MNFCLPTDCLWFSVAQIWYKKNAISCQSGIKFLIYYIQRPHTVNRNRQKWILNEIFALRVTEFPCYLSANNFQTNQIWTMRTESSSGNRWRMKYLIHDTSQNSYFPTNGIMTMCRGFLHGLPEMIEIVQSAYQIVIVGYETATWSELLWTKEGRCGRHDQIDSENGKSKLGSL